MPITICMLQILPRKIDQFKVKIL